MESDPQPPEEFVELGSYSVVDLQRLLPALDAANVNYRVELRDGVSEISPAASWFGGAFGQGAQGTVRIAPGEKETVRRIHAELFGDCLPNYDSEFFRERGYAEPSEEGNA